MFVTIPLVQRREAGIHLLYRDSIVILGEIEDNSLDERLDVEAGPEDRDMRGHGAELADEVVKYLTKGNFLLDVVCLRAVTEADMSANQHYAVVISDNLLHYCN